jgi:hypothetical protein
MNLAGPNLLASRRRPVYRRLVAVFLVRGRGQHQAGATADFTGGVRPTGVEAKRKAGTDRRTAIG